MNKCLKLFLSGLLLVLASSCQRAQQPALINPDQTPRGTFHPLDNETDPNKVPNWFTKGPEQNVEGVNTEKIYTHLNFNYQTQDVIVAVIDSGIDINHDDLRQKIWINQAEANGKKGLDDDNNGYIDDIHGWNFLGGYDSHGQPTHINQERLESTRELARLRKLKNDLELAGEKLSQHEQAYFEKLDTQLAGDRNVVSFQIFYTENTIQRLQLYYETLELLLQVPFDLLTVEDVEKIVPNSSDQQIAKEGLLSEFSVSGAKSVERLHFRVTNMKNMLNTALNENFDPRKIIINDDPNDFSNGNYGNNDVMGPDPLHGTHVAGIIAATRNNGLGMDGVSHFAKIMVLRAIPNGDEYDKDIYFAIKYAVDNGARIINMSFGKRYSPHKNKMDQIFRYASDKGVLLVHAAGNSGFDTDRVATFPNRYYDYPRIDSEIKTWIEVGASSRHNTMALVANFSNYGKKNVDIFAPGHEITSTTPGNNYAIYSGTSMATPVVAGVASILMAQKPSLSAIEIKKAILRSGRDKNELTVIRPGLGDQVLFSQLCRTGMIVDGYKALQHVLR